MTIDNIPVEKTLAAVKRQLEEEKNLSPALRASLELLLTLTTVLLNRLGLNSGNSSKPPSSDPNRKKKRNNGNNSPGGQKGHSGNHLELVDDPDHVESLKVDRATLPTAGTFRCIGYERRQVFDIQISRVVTEYQAEILEDERGRRVVAPFPEHVKVKTQYASGGQDPVGLHVQLPTPPLQADRGAFCRSVRDTAQCRQHLQLQQGGVREAGPVRGLGENSAAKGPVAPCRRDRHQHRWKTEMAACGMQHHRDTADWLQHGWQ
ncbi:MAG: DUF6444 domain-containing protein [Gammaproteobacteria bacterium]|nr:DUF6444 domain-containing protein [Gammaproteobacteria bacterium]